MGVTVGSSLSNVSNGVAGIFSYVKLLVEGKSNASTTGDVLGNKFFLGTEENCINQNTNKKEKRTLYFDNVPSGTMGISKDTGGNLSGFRGLIPGAVEDVMAIGKIDFFGAFTQTGVPKCLPVKLITIDVNNKKSNDTQLVTVDDINEISPCNFVSRTNPVNGNVCTRQGFAMPDDDTNEDKNNAELKKKYNQISNNIKNKLPSVPSDLSDEMNLNILKSKIKRNNLGEYAADYFRDDTSQIVSFLNKEGKSALFGIQREDGIYTIIGEKSVYYSTVSGKTGEISLSEFSEILHHNAMQKGKGGNFEFLKKFKI